MFVINVFIYFNFDATKIWPLIHVRLGLFEKEEIHNFAKMVESGGKLDRV